MTVVCFLQLDGVLHRAGSFVASTGKVQLTTLGAEPFEWSWRVATLVEHRDLEFVICSPWLQRMSLQQLREQAPAWMRPRIVGACERCEELDELQHVHRRTSAWSVIDAYVRTHGIKHWLAVDHTDNGWPDDVETRQRLVLCNAETGLSDQKALSNFTDAVLRELRLAGEHFSASLNITLHDDCPIAVQERWHLDFWLPSSDEASPVPVAFFDEQAGRPQRTAILDERGSDALASFAVRALCAARFETLAAAAEWRPHYRWNRLSFALQSVGPLPIGRAWLRLVVELRGAEYRMTYRHEDGWVESDWYSLTEEDSAPLALLKRAVTTAVGAVRRLPC